MCLEKSPLAERVGSLALLLLSEPDNVGNSAITSLMKFSKIACLVVLAGLDYTAAMFSQTAADTPANTVRAQPLPALLPRRKEIELALGAAPEHLRKGAGVYALERNGFVKVRNSA